MSSPIGKFVRLKVLEDLTDSFPAILYVFRHSFRIGLSSYLLTYKVPVLFPLVALIVLVLIRNAYTSILIQVIFIFALLGSNRMQPQERLKRFSPILRELFRYKNLNIECKAAIVHLALTVFSYFLNWLLLFYYALAMVFL